MRAVSDRTFSERVYDRIVAPQPLVRLEIIRIGAPLAILGFLSSRLVHADDWLSEAGFHVPSIPGDWRQPIEVPPLPTWLAWSIAIAIAVTGLAVAAGFLTRWSAGLFALLLGYVGLADRLEAFTVSKLAPMIALALCLTPSGTRYGIDAWLRRRRDPDAVVPALVTGGCVSIFQILIPTFYFSSGVCKARGDWLADAHVLWSHLHDSYQTWFSWFLGNHLPAFAWTLFQATTLAFEALAPLWFLLRFTRKYALLYGCGMHLMIGLMFGPVIWFALLMIVLLVASFTPVEWLERVRLVQRAQ